MLGGMPPMIERQYVLIIHKNMVLIGGVNLNTQVVVSLIKAGND
jgi:hypothetical protein